MHGEDPRDQKKNLLMTSVLDHKADVVVTGKVNGSHNIGTAGNIDSVVREVAELASLALSGEGIAALVGKEHLHHRGGRIKARDVVSILSLLDNCIQHNSKCDMELTGPQVPPRHFAEPCKQRHRSWDRGKGYQWAQ